MNNSEYEFDEELEEDFVPVRAEFSVDTRENVIGVCRIMSVKAYDENDNEKDYTNQFDVEDYFHSRAAIRKAIACKLKIDPETVKLEDEKMFETPWDN